MPTDSPRLIPVPRESLARVLQHAAGRAHSDPAESRAWEALQAAMDAAASPAPFAPLPIHAPRPTTIGALVDALRADMERLRIRQLEVTQRGIVVDLVQSEVTPCPA